MPSASRDLDGAILSGERSVTLSDLYERVGRVAAGFSDLGVGRGSTVAIMLRNDIAFFEASMGANVAGAYAVPINWHYTAEEAGYILRDSGAGVLVIHADLLPAIRNGIPDRVKVFVVPTPPEIADAYKLVRAEIPQPATLPVWNEWLAGQPARSLDALPPPASMIYTSGTTGRPKGVRRNPFTPKTAARFQEMVKTSFGLRPGGGFRTVITGPMYHTAPNAYSLFAARNGGFCVLQPRFDAEQLLKLIERYRITHLHLVPTMFVRLLGLSEAVKAKYDLSSLEFVAHGAAPCPPGIKRRMIEWWGPVINEYYGASETGTTVFHTAEEALKKPGTVGRIVAGATVRIYRDDGTVADPGEIGDIYMRIHDLPDFTYHGQDAQRRAVERDGLITAGDVGYLDQDGYLFLCDRKKDVVISGGTNIYPAEIEAALLGVQGVRDCAVFGIPDDTFGEALCAYVQPEPGVMLNAEQLRAALEGKIARYKIPNVFEFRDELPREDSGKIFKRKLRAPYWEHAGRNI